MSRMIEIAGGFRRDEDEACRLSGSVEQAAAERTRPRRGDKPNPFDAPETPMKPDPFSDVELPKKKIPGKPNPFSDVE
jgi:hypothetical protein